MAEIIRAIKGPVGRRGLAYIEEFAPTWISRVTRQRGDRTERLFWQSGGGYDRNVWDPKVLMTMIGYVHENPVRRELVDRATEWTWSSAGWFADEPTCDLIPDLIPPEWTTPS
ncbi:hypothetical protein [Aquisphaera insulae]|uniref:hypothetical protein n=1 Tax=Aquisphaera insulae TaxID=2712864 RepID=UPI00196AF78E|nr:hypothetical protein [Aquisphaera insulae]